MGPLHYTVIGMGGVIAFLLVLLSAVARSGQTLRGWQQATMDRLEDAMHGLASARYAARDGDWNESIRQVVQAQEDLQEIHDYPSRYKELRDIQDEQREPRESGE